MAGFVSTAENNLSDMVVKKLLPLFIFLRNTVVIKPLLDSRVVVPIYWNNAVVCVSDKGSRF